MQGPPAAQQPHAVVSRSEEAQEAPIQKQVEDRVQFAEAVAQLAPQTPIQKQVVEDCMQFEEVVQLQGQRRRRGSRKLFWHARRTCTKCSFRGSWRRPRTCRGWFSSWSGSGRP